MSRRASRYRISVRQHVRPAPFRGDRLRTLIRRAVRILGVAEADLRILVVADEEMGRMNREYLGRKGTTNVISFPEEDAGKGRTFRLAGDILVSAPVCLSQTRDWPCTPEEKVFFFIVHGVLHLLGFDHERGGREAVQMRREEVRVYRSCLEEGMSPV